MEKNYSLKSIRTNPSTDFLSVTASIFLGQRRIGAIRTSPDTEVIEFFFSFAIDRIVFESFITDWWVKEDRSMHFDLNELAMHARYQDCQPALEIKMRCWVRSIVRPSTNTRVRPVLAAAA